MNNVILQPGTVLQGRYLIERLISQGGMGAVYQAIDQRLGSIVALKQILVGDAGMRKAFEREARLLASLRHPALPVVSDHFTEEAGQFLVMQFIPGDDLGSMLDRKSNTFTTVSALPQVLLWADQLLDALHYLHSHDPPIIHRDIKPQNLKLTPRGEIVLLDFGLAKGSANPSLSTTARSVRAYTTQYAPLEQIQGTGTEPRSDLYSLAATLYHVLTGEAPPNALTRASAVLAGKPDPLIPIHKLNPHVPPAIAAIIHQAMAHGIAKRFASAALMRTALHVVYPITSTGSASPISSVGQPTIVVSAGTVSVAQIQETPATAAISSATEVPTAPVLIVSQQGQGHHRTISEAISSAQPGSRILVRPGRYRESLVIDKLLEIIGDGPLSEIILESSDTPCVLMKTDYATVRGLSIHGCVGMPQATNPTVHIPLGRLSLENCAITSDGRLCVVIHSAAANPVIWRCQIHSKGIGILFYNRSRGTVEECDIFNNTQAGIAIRLGGNPTIRRCTIHHNTQDGIYVDEKGLGTVEECEISANTRAGIEIKRGSTPFIRGCKIYDQTKGYGIYVCDRGEGYIEECDISQNARAGVAIVQASNPLVRRCKIHHERQRGIFFGEHGQGMLEQCSIFENARVGIEICQGSSPVLRHCNINNHSMLAVWVHQRGSGHFERCDLTRNARGAWYIEEGCKVSRRGNKE